MGKETNKGTIKITLPQPVRYFRHERETWVLISTGVLKDGIRTQKVLNAGLTITISNEVKYVTLEGKSYGTVSFMVRGIKYRLIVDEIGLDLKAQLQYPFRRENLREEPEDYFLNT